MPDPSRQSTNGEVWGYLAPPPRRRQQLAEEEVAAEGPVGLTLRLRSSVNQCLLSGIRFPI